MAISKILYIGTPQKGGKQQCLKNAINYVLNPLKTDNGRYTGAVNCITETALKDMTGTKEVAGKTDKRQGYHLILSFNKEERDKDTAFKILEEFAQKYLGERFEAVYSLHTDTDHLHGHIVFNSVSFSDLYKFRYENGDWAKYIQPLADEICEKHGFEKLESDEELQEHYGSGSKRVDNISTGSRNKYKNERDPNFINWSEYIKKDFDRLIAESKDFDDFIDRLRAEGYEIRADNRKHIAVKPPGMKRYRRIDGGAMEGYSKEAIERKISACRENVINPSERKYVLTLNGIVCSRVRVRIHKLPGFIIKKRKRLIRMNIIKNKSFRAAYQKRMSLYDYRKLWEEYNFMMKIKMVSRNDLYNLDRYFNKLEEEVRELRKELHDGNDLTAEAAVRQRIQEKQKQIRKEKAVVRRLLSQDGKEKYVRNVHEQREYEKKCPKVP